MVKVKPWLGPAVLYTAPTSGLGRLAQVSAFARPSMYIWTMMGALVLGSMAHPVEVTVPDPVLTESTWPKGLPADSNQLCGRPMADAKAEPLVDTDFVVDPYL